MKHGEPETPARLPGGRQDPDCEEASAAILRYMEGRLDADAVGELRDHLGRCATCNSEYRELLLVRARIVRASMGKGPVTSSEAAAAVAVRNERIVSYSKRERGWRLRLLLLPAAVILLLMGVSRLRNHQPMVPLACLVGVTITPGGPMAARSEDRHLQRGDWCGTEPGSRARIDFAAASAELGPNTWILLEHVTESRMRLQWGVLELDGPCGVATELGALDVNEGRARVSLTREDLSIECRTGSLTWLDPGGERVLSAGEVLHLSRTAPQVR